MLSFRMSSASLFYLILANVLGGASAPVGSWTLATWHPASAAFWRTLLTGALFIPFAVIGLRKLTVTREDWLRMAGVGVLGYGVPILIGSFGLAHSTATEAALLTSVEPVCILIMSALILREALNARKTAAVVCGLGGSLLIILQGLPLVTELSAPHWRGDALLFTQGFFWALYTIIGKKALERVDPMTFTAVTTLISVPVLALATALGPRAPWGANAPLVLGVAMTFFGPLVWNYAMEVVPASALANFVFLQPLVGVGIGVLFQGNAFTRWSAAGGALIILGVYTAAKERTDEGKDLRIREVLDVPQGA